MPGRKADAAKRLFNIVVKDGYTTQTVEMKYGKSPFGYTTYYANQSIIYVNAKSKKVTFTVKKNTSSRYGNFHFASTKLKPSKKAKSNLFTFTTDGKKKAWMFAVQKISDPEIKYVKMYNTTKGSVFVPKKNRYVKIKTAVKTEIPVKVNIKILNEKRKTVFWQNYGKAGSKTYVIKWNGKPSKKNPAKYKTSSYVPAGEYTVKVTARLLDGTNKQTFMKEKKLTVGEK